MRMWSLIQIGVVERLGISYDDLIAINPKLIYISVYGFGHEGPDAHRRAYDNVVQAFFGVTYNQADAERVSQRNVIKRLPTR